MKNIYKYPLEPKIGTHSLNLPCDSEILMVAADNEDAISVWAEVPQENAKDDCFLAIKVILAWTGYVAPDGCEYKNTFQARGIIWHAYITQEDIKL